MQNGEGLLAEIYDESAGAAGLIRCPDGLIPSPGQYVLAGQAEDGVSPVGPLGILAIPIFPAGKASGGFRAAPSLPEGWKPGTRLALRGPLGRGFHLPPGVRRFALVAWDDSPARLLALLPQALAQGAEVTLVCHSAPRDLPEEIEIQPLAALDEICAWADFLAVDTKRESLAGLVHRLPRGRGIEAQVLVRTDMPCGALAECGVCAVTVRHGWKMACKDGPVFDWRELGD